MRIGELSRRTGVPVPTIKYYLREELVPHGERTGRNQADYGEPHVHRVRLVRALVEVGGLSIAAAREVLTLMHAPGKAPLESIGKVHFAVQAARAPRTESPSEEAVARAEDLIARRGWQVRPTNPARHALAGALDHVARLDAAPLLDLYAEAAERLAEAEVESLTHEAIDRMAERVVTMTVLGNELLAALRGLAQESVATAKMT